MPWALEIDDAHLPAGFPSGTTFHPTFLYEMLWCIAGFMFLLWAERKFSLHGGQVLALYIIVYTLGRVWIEYLRIDDATMIMGLRLNVWTSLIVCVGGILAFFWLRDRLKTHPEMADIYRVQPEVTDEQKVIG